MTPFQTSLLVWGLWGLLFLALEIAGWRKWVPWNTLSWTVWQIFARSIFVEIVEIGLMFSLLLHFALGWPNRSRHKRQDDE
jgi:hypothetical protein